jgi:hypothetical protein
MPANWNSYLTWVEPADAFSAAVPPDATVRSWKLTAAEGQGATFTVSMKRFAGGPLAPGRKRWAYLWRKNAAGTVDVVIAKGRLVGLPKWSAQSDWVTLKFECLPPDWQQKKLDAVLPLAVLPWFDPILSGAGAIDDADEILEGRRARVEWDRVTLLPVVVDILGTGRPTVALANGSYKDAECDQVGNPITEVQLELTSEWTQHRASIFDAWPAIKAAFVAGVVNTLTPAEFAQGFPQVGSSVNGQSGYQCVKSQLFEIDPPAGQSGVVGPFDASSVAVPYVADWINNPNLLLPPPIARSTWVQRTWIDGVLQYFWSRRQKRIEKIVCTIMSAGQDIGLGQTNILKMPLKTQNVSLDAVTNLFEPGVDVAEGDRIKVGEVIWEASRAHMTAGSFDADFRGIEVVGGVNVLVPNWVRLGVNQSALGGKDKDSYYLLPRGLQTFGAAVLKVLAKIAASMRCGEVRITAPLTDAILAITTAHKVSIEGPQIDGGTAEGKVVNYTFSSSKGEDLAEIVIHCCTGKGEDNTPPAPVGTGGWANPGGASYDAVSWADFSDQTAPPLLNGGLAAVAVVNEPDTPDDSAPGQIDTIYANCYDEGSGRIDEKETDPVNILKSIATSVQLLFANIASADEDPHEIDVTMLNGWSGPRQIDFEAAP